MEKPFVEQLLGLGWQHVEGDVDQPASTGGTSFTEVIQEATLRRKVPELNVREIDGKPVPWLDEGRMSQAVGAITRISATV